MNNRTSEPVRQSSRRTCGRLTALASRFKLDDSVSPELRGKVIYFPSMPETLDIVRKADYAVTPPTRFIPDGIHVYKGTAPLEIPVQFKLASNDEDYCPDGSYSLLQVASLLHAMVLPLGDSTIPNTASYQTHTVGEAKAQQATDPAEVSISVSSPQEDSLRPPVTCALELMRTDEGGPGIICIGYVKDVSTKFGGPWLKGPHNSYNLPSFCDFSFTFVHAPGYGNDYGKAGDLGQNVNAYADWVTKRFYNTWEISKKGGMNYRGFDAPAQEDASITGEPKYNVGQASILDPDFVADYYRVLDPADLLLPSPSTTPVAVFGGTPVPKGTSNYQVNRDGTVTKINQSTLLPTQSGPQRSSAVSEHFNPQRVTGVRTY